MIDSLKQKLEINDYVMFIPPGCRTLVLGVVVKLTPKGAKLSCQDGEYSRESCYIIKINAVIKENPELLI